MEEGTVIGCESGKGLLHERGAAAPFKNKMKKGFCYEEEHAKIIKKIFAVIFDDDTWFSVFHYQ